MFYDLLKWEKRMNFKKGIYYIGDPIYLFSENWDEVLEETNSFNEKLNGYTVAGGETSFGNGQYEDNFGRKYGVNSGILAILPSDVVDIKKIYSIEKSKIMHLVEFEEDFNVEIDDGIFIFGEVQIDTKKDNNFDQYNDEFDDDCNFKSNDDDF
jgi:hypothetical protein